MAKKGRKTTKQEAVKVDEPVTESTDANGDAPAAAEENEVDPPKRANKRGASTSKEETPAKKKRGKADTAENGDAATRPKRATATKASKQVKSLLTPKKPVAKKMAKRAPRPKKEPSQFEVESIIDSRKRKGRVEYKIRWKGYTASSDTWEPKRNLNCTEILEAWEAERAKEKAE